MAAAAEEVLLLILFDLDRFKAYNERLRHPAGATLPGAPRPRLHKHRRRASPIAWAATSFCRPSAVPPSSTSPWHSRRPITLSASARASASRLRIGSGAADRRLRTRRRRSARRPSALLCGEGDSRASAERQATDALLGAVERDPDLGVHLRDVTDLSEAVADTLGRPGGEGEESSSLTASAPHQKVGVPDKFWRSHAARRGSVPSFGHQHPDRREADPEHGARALADGEDRRSTAPALSTGRGIPTASWARTCRSPRA